MSASCRSCLLLATRLNMCSGGGRITGLRCITSAKAVGGLWSATIRNLSPSAKNKFPKLASQIRVAFTRMAWKTDSSSPGEPAMTRSTSDVAASRSNASASFFSSSEVEARLRPARVLAFVLVERGLRPCVRLFAPLRDKTTPGTSLDPSHRPPKAYHGSERRVHRASPPNWGMGCTTIATAYSEQFRSAHKTYGPLYGRLRVR